MATGTVGPVSLFGSPPVISVGTVITDQWGANVTASLNGIRQAIFGDGSDGSITVGGTTTLTRDMYYNNLTLGATDVLNTAGYRVFVANTLTIASGGVIKNNGTAASAGTIGTGGPAGSLGGGGDGGPGAASGGSNGTNESASLGGNGGDAGYGVASVNALHGVATPPTANMGSYRTAFAAVQGFMFGMVGGTPTLTALRGGAGGAGGGQDTSAGAGGGGGGVVMVAAQNMILAGTCFLSQGGAGGTPASGTRGGGGGGGGGLIIGVYGNISGGAALSTYCSATGGAAGSGVGGYSNGTSGSAGTIFSLIV